MLTLINTNRMRPPIAPVGLDYVAGAARRARIKVELLDLCLVERPKAALAKYFSRNTPELIGLTFRNVDDCFWPSGASFVPELKEIVATLRALCNAPLVLGGVGYSIFPVEILNRTGVDFGIRGDGEQALLQLLTELRGGRHWHKVDGLLWQENGGIHCNPPAWPSALNVPAKRNFVDNAAYFRLGGQIGVETKRGCCRQCIYCADPLAKGAALRLRSPAEVADEMQSLLSQGIDVLHLCDAEFNIPPDHALDVCEELIRRGLQRRVRWYTYMAVVPFDAELARRMARSGCVGVNFTSDAAHPAMLAAYRQPHRQDDLAVAVRLCRENGMAVMLDLLLGGPGETPETLGESLRFFRQIEPDCCGAALGVRIYPRTEMAAIVAKEGPWESNPSLRRHYTGPIDLLQPTFYISSALGANPARLVRELMSGDPRFFPPEEEMPPSENTETVRMPLAACPPVQRESVSFSKKKSPPPSSDHNYNRNQSLCDAIAAGARGAYWDILRKMKGN
jgi:tryptophan 2-C-methyltransferase